MTEIKFVNHASVLVSHGNIRLLSDPWYFGSAFADGWNLLYENSDAEIMAVLECTTHI
jgi:UDP-MurNAc hydroxylase